MCVFVDLVNLCPRADSQSLTEAAGLRAAASFQHLIRISYISQNR